MKKNKVLSMLLVLSMTLGLAACGNSKNSGSTEGTEAASSSSSSESEISMPSGYDDTSKEVYDAALGDFYEAYQKVDDASSLSERYALDALAEAKLLEELYGYLQVQKVVHTISAVLMRKVNQTYYGEMIMRDSIM